LKRQAEEVEGRAGKGEEMVVRLERSEQEQDRSLRQLEKEKDELHEIEVQLGSASRDKKHLESEIEVRHGEVEDIAGEIENIERKSDRLSSGVKQMEGPPSDKTVLELKTAVAAIHEDIAKHKASEAEISTKIRQYESVAERGKCPVCDRDADPEQFSDMVDGLSGERKKNSGHIGRLNAQLQESEDTLQKRRDYDALLVKAKDDLARAKEYEDESDKKKKKLDSVRAVLGAAEKSLSALDARIEVLKSEAEGLESLRRKIDSAQRELKATRDKIAELRSDVRKWREDARRFKESIARKEKLGAKGLELGEREIWLEEYFTPTVESIERYVMMSINREFGSSFQRWFGILVEDGGKEARVDEDFTPLVDQEGYEQDVEFLSGGERTSVALAYRLALSQMMQRFAEAGPSALILDEPTDGFSKEQLGKVREILDEMANPQVIIVSHERELESMADQIYRVAKVQGESKIT
jgi:DNA repair protein SbcC/Rad50